MKKLTKLAAVAFVAIVGAGLPGGMTKDLFRTGINPDYPICPPPAWCSNNSDCVVWGPGSACIKAPGQLCGRCT